MFNRILILLTLSIALSGLSLALYNYFQQPKIAYVRSHDLVSKYLGTKESMHNLKAKKDTWQSNIDTLTMNLQKAIDKYNREASSLSFSGRSEAEKRLTAQREQLVNYSNALDARVQEEDDRAMQGVLSQINSYIEEYGQEHGYDVILGTTVSGNVLYGQKSLDITDELLKELNKSYKTSAKN